MPKEYIYTSSLPIELKEELEQYASKHHISKNKVIEKALKNLFEEETHKDIIASFKKIADDPDVADTAEWGINDYKEQLKRYPE